MDKKTFLDEPDFTVDDIAAINQYINRLKLHKGQTPLLELTEPVDHIHKGYRLIMLHLIKHNVKMIYSETLKTIIVNAKFI